MKDALDTTLIISQHRNYSPKTDTYSEVLKRELAPDTPDVQVLCLTRWTVHAQSLESVPFKSYTVMQELWIDCKDFVKDADARGWIKGVSAHMKSFDFLFGVLLGELVLMHSDNLNKTIQHKNSLQLRVRLQQLYQ